MFMVGRCWLVERNLCRIFSCMGSVSEGFCGFRWSAMQLRIYDYCVACYVAGILYKL